MLTTFVIGLREGLEAALVVGIIAAFLIKRGNRNALRTMWWGVGIAVAISLGTAILLHLASRALTLRSREIMEGGLTLVAVAGVTYMIFWMRRHAATLKPELERRADSALERGSSTAIFVMALAAVLREGLETAVFLLATLENSATPASGLGGASFGILLSIVIGYGIYRGGIAIDLRRFFRITGLILVVVAAGLLAAAVHSLSEAGLITVLQGSAVDLSWLIGPGSAWSSLLTAFFGFQPVPTYAEVIAWAAFLVPMTLYVIGVIGSRPRARVAV